MPMPKEQQDYVVEFVVDKVEKIKKCLSGILSNVGEDIHCIRK